MNQRQEPRLHQTMPDGPSLRVGGGRRSPADPPPPVMVKRRSAAGWISGFLMGVFTLAFLIVGGWVALEWFVFPAMDAKVGGTLPAPVRQSPVIPDSALRSSAALSPVPIRNVPEVPVTMPAGNPAVPLPSAPPLPSAASVPLPAAAGAPIPAAPGEMVLVQGTGISLRSGPTNTDPVIATRPRGTALHVFARQGSWVQVGDTQPIGWGWAPLLATQPTGQDQPAIPH